MRQSYHPSRQLERISLQLARQLAANGQSVQRLKPVAGKVSGTHLAAADASADTRERQCGVGCGLGNVSGWVGFDRGVGSRSAAPADVVPVVGPLSIGPWLGVDARIRDFSPVRGARPSASVLRATCVSTPRPEASAQCGGSGRWHSWGPAVSADVLAMAPTRIVPPTVDAGGGAGRELIHGCPVEAETQLWSRPADLRCQQRPVRYPATTSGQLRHADE